MEAGTSCRQLVVILEAKDTAVPSPKRVSRAETRAVQHIKQLEAEAAAGNNYVLFPMPLGCLKRQGGYLGCNGPFKSIQ
jgi:hypothetical protein